MSLIFTADLHLNPKPADEYRWKLLEEWLPQQKADELVIGGDLTDAKDRHDARLVNRLHKAIDLLADHFVIYIVMGNHDYFDRDHPFFNFLDNERRDVFFITAPERHDLSIGNGYLVPAEENWDKVVSKLKAVDYLFTHATFTGAVSENGTTMTGVDPGYLDDFKGYCLSGDIHVPQIVRRGIEYVGAPYHTRFGDDFEPRLIRIDDKGNRSDLHFPAPRKVTIAIRSPDELREVDQVRRGDHVKARCFLRRAEYVEWRAYREQIKKFAESAGWVLCGTEAIPVEGQRDTGDTAAREGGEPVRAVVNPSELVSAYAKRHKGSKEHIRIGNELIAGEN